jgi:Xaa-Pro aminopeptidase
MTTSNEPGYYEDGEFGIRIENVCVTVPSATPNNFGNKNFCQFETVTMCPIETSLIDLSLLDDNEINWLNDYHAKVLRTLTPLMTEVFPEAIPYLVQKTLVVSR